MKPSHKPNSLRLLGFISDIHGNLPALEAVLEQLTIKAVDEIYVAGDLLFGGDHPLQVWKRLQQVGAVCTRGPSDMALVSIDPSTLKPADEEEEKMARRFSETRKQLGDLILKRIARLPDRVRVAMTNGAELLVMNGCPSDPLESISHDMDDDEIRNRLADECADVVICGGSHVPFEREVDGIRVVNVGSVGESPAGNCANYTIIAENEEGAFIEQGWVEY